MIREAETRDMLFILSMFTDMVGYLRGVVTLDRYAKDMNKLIGGAMMFIAERMQSDSSLVLVAEEDTKVSGFLIGRMVVLPPFLEHTIVGDVEALFPIYPGITVPLVSEFDSWAMSKGATCRVGRVEIGNDLVDKIYTRKAKMTPMFTESFYPYKEVG